MVMKKFIAVFLTLILTFMFLPTENLHAETTQSFTLYYTNPEDVNENITEQWTVTLPTSINLGSSTSKDYNITVKGDVLDESVITVVPDSSFTMKDLFNRSLTATVAQSESTWTASEINAASGTTHSGTISLESLPAGSWSGNLNFNVELGFVPGLYALDGTLSKSWQELLDESTIHVTDGVLTTNYVYDEETDDASNTSADALVGRLVIPKGVTSLGLGAFTLCSNLTSVKIPDSVTSIGDRAFKNVPNVNYTGSATGSPWGAKAINGVPVE